MLAILAGFVRLGTALTSEAARALDFAAAAAFAGPRRASLARGSNAVVAAATTGKSSARA